MQQAIEALNYRINIESQSLAMCPPDSPDIIIHQTTIAELRKAIHLIQASIDMRHCPPVEPGFNAALHDLGHSLSVHKHLETALYGTPKGSYHSLCIVEIEQAIQVLTSHALDVEFLSKP